MNVMKSLFFFILLLFYGCGSAGSIHDEQGQEEAIAFTGMKIYPSPDDTPILNGTVLVERGMIRRLGTADKIRIPKHFRVVDCSGMVMTAGFWNSHVHLMEPKWAGADTLAPEVLEGHLREMLTSYGFTYAFDLATLDIDNLNALRRRIASGELAGPELLVVGVPFTAHSPYYIEPLKLPELSTPAQVEEHIRQQLALGADGIKLWSASPTGHSVELMPEDLALAAVALGKKHGKPVFAHPSNEEGMLAAVRYGVGVLAHVAPDDRRPLDEESIRMMISAKVALIPTLKLFGWELQHEGLDPRGNLLVQTAVQHLQAFADAGGTVLFGTDAGYMTDYSPEEEYLLMQQAGMSFPQILASLTTTPAERFGFAGNRGSVAENRQADLVLLLADPGEDIRNFTKVAQVYRKGRLLYAHQGEGRQ